MVASPLGAVGLDSSRPPLFPVLSAESLEAARTFSGALELGADEWVPLTSVYGASRGAPGPQGGDAVGAETDTEPPFQNLHSGGGDRPWQTHKPYPQREQKQSSRQGGWVHLLGSPRTRKGF